jgi:hypothetical protein
LIFLPLKEMLWEASGDSATASSASAFIGKKLSSPFKWAEASRKNQFLVLLRHKAFRGCLAIGVRSMGIAAI